MVHRLSHMRECLQTGEGFGARQYGIKVVEFSYEKEGRRIIDNHPILTEHCTFCMDRVRNGDKPSCVQHCQSQCLQFGKVEELIKVLKKNGKGVLWTYPHANK